MYSVLVAKLRLPQLLLEFHLGEPPDPHLNLARRTAAPFAAQTMKAPAPLCARLASPQRHG